MRLLHAGFAITLACCLQAQDPSDPPAKIIFISGPVDVPMPRINHRPAVEATVNGSGALRLAVEWGADVSSVSQKVAKDLNLPIVGEARLSPTRTAKLAKVDKITVGGVAFHDLTVLVGAFLDPDIDGFLGTNLFRSSLITLDYPASRVRIEQGALTEPNGLDILPLAGEDVAGRPDVTFDIQGVKISGVLDTRGPGWITLPDRLIPSLKLFDATETAHSDGPSLGVQDFQSRRLNGVAKFGKFTIEQPILAFRKYSHAIAGYDLLENFRVTLDLKNKRVRFERSAEGPIHVPVEPWEKR